MGRFLRGCDTFPSFLILVPGVRSPGQVLVLLLVKVGMGLGRNRKYRLKAHSSARVHEHVPRHTARAGARRRTRHKEHTCACSDCACSDALRHTDMHRHTQAHDTSMHTCARVCILLRRTRYIHGHTCVHRRTYTQMRRFREKA